MVIVASEVTTFNPLDLDHARAEVRKLQGSERCGDGLLQTDDDHTLEGCSPLGSGDAGPPLATLVPAEAAHRGCE